MNITFDIETLGRSPDSPIVQIGAVKFTDEGEITDEFVRYIDLSKLDRYDFDYNPDTLKWWFSQNDITIKQVMCNEQGIDLRQALFEFINWIGSPSDYVYWTHATFDPPILLGNMEKVGIKNPIPYRAHRDIRTLTHFVGKIEVEKPRVAHDGLEDAKFQARYISIGLQRLNKYNELIGKEELQGSMLD